MYLPVTLPPIAAVVMAEAAFDAIDGVNGRSPAFVLGITSVLGVAGVGFHCYGVSRAMVAGRTGARTSSTGRPCRPLRALSGWRSAASPR